MTALEAAIDRIAPRHAPAPSRRILNRMTQFAGQKYSGALFLAATDALTYGLISTVFKGTLDGTTSDSTICTQREKLRRF